MNYFVVDPSGTRYGPADMNLLQQWAREGRIEPGSMLADASGATMLASSIPGLFPGPSAYMSPGPYAAPPGPYTQPIGQPGVYYPRPQLAPGYATTELIVAWVCAALSIVGVLCCALLSIICGILGIVFAKKALAAGDGRGQGALVVSFVGLGIGVVLVIINIFALMAMRS